MNIPIKAEYALKAILELSFHWPKSDPLGVSIISKNQGIPLKFLTQILLQLKSFGLVESVRGKQGGYILVRNPNQITLGNVLAPYLKTDIKRRKKDVVTEVIMEADNMLIEHLNSISFDDMIKRHRALDKAPMYTI